MMWLFSKDSLSNFPFTKVSDKGIQLLNGWTLYNCTSKKGEELSMWIHDTTNVSESTHVQNAMKRIKTLRHPDIVSFVDGCEGAKEIQIVTERVQTLDQYLREKSDSGNMTFISSWGLYEVMRALVFLSETCKCRHNQVRLSSIFVNKSGDWKIGALDHVCGNDETVPGTIIQNELYWPQDRLLIDSYGLGCLIWEVYNRSLTSVSDLKSTGSMPAQLVKVFHRLIHPRSKARISLATAFKEVTSNGGLCDNYYVQTLLFLEEIQIKDEQEKKTFMATLSDRVDSFPDEINKYKVLPHLLTCHQFGSAGIEVLVPLVKLGKLLEPAEFETKVVPCLIAMFRSSHRGTRVRLLEQLSSFIDHLPLKIVDQEIFPAVLLGMTDTNPVVREATIRSVVHLAPKLSPKNLNETLMKHIMNTQLKDEQGGIRTNATVCLAKISPHLSVATRQTHLLNVLLKCTRDPFAPARVNAVSALAASQHFFLVEDVATKLLPCLSFLTVDTEQQVRQHTFKTIRFALARLEQVSEDPGNGGKVCAVEDKEAQNGMSWTNWAVNLSTRLIKKQAVEGRDEGDRRRERDDDKMGVAGGMTAMVDTEGRKEERDGIMDDKEEEGDGETGWEGRDNEWAMTRDEAQDNKKGHEEGEEQGAPVRDLGGFDDDPDSFFDKLLMAESTKTTKKGTLNLGKVGSRKQGGTVLKEGAGGNRNGVSVVRGTRKMTKEAKETDDGWGDTDW